jgi:hypothetical protein
MIPRNMVPGNMIPGMNLDLPFFQATLGRAYRAKITKFSNSQFASCYFERPPSDKAHWNASVTRRGCGRVVHHLVSFLAMVWIEVIIVTILGRRQTAPVGVMQFGAAASPAWATAGRSCLMRCGFQQVIIRYLVYQDGCRGSTICLRLGGTPPPPLSLKVLLGAGFGKSCP